MIFHIFSEWLSAKNKLLGEEKWTLDKIILHRDLADYVKTVEIGEKKIQGEEFRLIDGEGEKSEVKIISTRDALELAKERNLDLVEVSPNANPPVCKILNFGKYRYEQEKRLRDSRKNQKALKNKEIRMQPKIGAGDLDTKAKHIQEFLDDGNKVKVTIRFRGRELAHTELGFDVLKEVEKRLREGSYVIEKAPAMEGRFMSMTLNSKVK